MKLRALTTTLLCLAFVLSAKPRAQAYKPETHGDLTTLSWLLLSHCGMVRESPLTTELASIVKANNRYEDLQNPLKRLKDWHFYDRTRAKEKILMGRIHSTMHPRFDQINKKLAEAKSLRQRAALLGSAIHFLQDVTVPAHVVPVFHGLPSTIGKLTDAFDTYPIQLTRLQNEFANACRNLKTAAAFSLNERLDMTATETQRLLDTEFELVSKNKSEKLAWRAFWPKEKSYKYGRYSKVLKPFGTIEGHGPYQNGTIAKEEFDRIAADLQLLAIEQTAIVIYQNLLTEPK